MKPSNWTDQTTPLPLPDGSYPRVNTVNPHLADARALTQRLQKQLQQEPNQRLLRAFTALADGDKSVGLLAFYLWRRRARRRT